MSRHVHCLFIYPHFLFPSQSDFVCVNAFFSLAKLPNHLRPYMDAYVDAFFSLPIVRHNGMRLTYEDVVNQLDNDTVEYGVELGVSGFFEEKLRVSIEVEVAAYETAIAWLRDLIYGSEFDKERCAFLLICQGVSDIKIKSSIQVVLAKLQQVIPEWKRCGSDVLYSLWSDLIYAENSTPRFGHVLQQADIIPELIQRLQESPEDVLADFESIRQHGAV